MSFAGRGIRAHGHRDEATQKPARLLIQNQSLAYYSNCLRDHLFARSNWKGCVMRTWWTATACVTTLAAVLAVVLFANYGALSPYFQGVAVETAGVLLEILL